MLPFCSQINKWVDKEIDEENKNIYDVIDEYIWIKFTDSNYVLNLEQSFNGATATSMYNDLEDS